MCVDEMMDSKFLTKPCPFDFLRVRAPDLARAVGAERANAQLLQKSDHPLPKSDLLLPKSAPPLLPNAALAIGLRVGSHHNALASRSEITLRVGLALLHATAIVAEGKTKTKDDGGDSDRGVATCLLIQVKIAGQSTIFTRKSDRKMI